MDDDQQIPEMVWDDMARAADLADDLARQGRAVRFGRGARSYGVDVELVAGDGASVLALRAGDIADVKTFAALVSLG